MKKKSVVLCLILISFVILIIIFLTIQFSFNREDKDDLSNKKSSTSLTVSNSNEKSKERSTSASNNWNSLSLNEQIARLVIALANTSGTASSRNLILDGDYFAMTGTTDNGTLYIKSANFYSQLGTIKIVGDTVNIVNTVGSGNGTESLEQIISDSSEEMVNQISKKIVSLNSLKLSLRMNMDEISQKEYSSLNGTWINGNGHFITFNNGIFTSDAKSFDRNIEYHLEQLPGDPALGSPFTLGVEGVENTYLSFAPVGDKVGSDVPDDLIDSKIVDATDSTRPRIMVTHGVYIAKYFSSELDGQTTVFYKK